jgi:DNA-binding GntR family transcriptional regulator
MQRLEADGVAVKQPYQGWFVREFTREQIHDLYECRAEMESVAARLACERITEPEIDWLRGHQQVGAETLSRGDQDAYRVYNRDLHAAILRAARNTYLHSMMSQLQLQSEMLTSRTIRIAGRPPRALEEHARLIEMIAERNADKAAELIRGHILSAHEDYVRSAA